MTTDMPAIEAPRLYLRPSSPTGLLPAWLPGIARVVAPSTPQEKSVPPRPIRLLLADDESDILTFLVFILNRQGGGFEIRTAADGVEAVEAALDMRPDIALINYMMPRMNDIQACWEISRLPALDGLPIVVFSCCHLPDFRPAALEAGACVCWHTPDFIPGFRHRVLDVLDGRERDSRRRRP